LRNLPTQLSGTRKLETSPNLFLIYWPEPDAKRPAPKTTLSLAVLEVRAQHAAPVNPLSNTYAAVN